MRRALLVSAVLTASAFALPAAAQTSGYLNWAGRPDPVVAQAAQSSAGPAWRLANGSLNAPGRLPHGGYDHRADPPQYGLTAAPGTRGDALTPASDWTQPQPLQMAAPVRRSPYRSMSSPAQAYYRQGNGDTYYRDMGEAATVAPVQPNYAEAAPASRGPVETSAMPAVRSGPVYAEDQPGPAPISSAAPRPSAPSRPFAASSSSPSTAATYAPPGPAPEYLPPDARGATAAPSVPSVADVDPMAPRRDAPIFRIQRDQANETSGQQPSRRYSVHRQNGQEPDPAPLPEGGYIDGLAISIPETLASEDLARPPDPPVLTRDNQGRVRAMPAPSEGDHQ